MRTAKKNNGSGSLALVRRLAQDGHRTFTAATAVALAPQVGLTPGYAKHALQTLANSGWIVRLRRGLYSLTAAVPGVTPLHEFEIAMALVSPAAISHWSAMRYHNLTDQIPRKVFVLTAIGVNIPRERGRNNVPGEKGISVQGTQFHFVQVKPDRFFGMQKVWVGEAQVTVTDTERTLLDGLDRPKYCGDFAEVIHTFQLRGKQLDLDRIISYALKFDVSVAKRLGWVLERQNVRLTTLEQLAALPVKGYLMLDPSGPRRGPINHRWLVKENLPGRIAQ